MSRVVVTYDAGAFDADGTPLNVVTSATPVTSVFSRTGAVVAVTGDYGGVVAAFLTGATSASRYVGGTTSGAPVSGTFAVGDFVIARDGHLFVCTTAGSPGTWTDVGSGGGSVSYATPGIVLGSSAAAGSASTVIRSDSTIAAFDATSPTTQAFGDSAAVGSAAFAARRDHKHAMPATPVTSINKTGSTALTGAVTLTGGTNVTLTQSGQDVSIAAAGSAAGSPTLLYDYEVSGSDKASIDTGVDTPQAGSAGTSAFPSGGVLEIFAYVRIDEALTDGQVNVTFNNDTGAVYDQQRWQALNATQQAPASSVGATSITYLVSAASAQANAFSAVQIRIPNYAGTVGYKAGDSGLYGALDTSAANDRGGQKVFLYRSTSAITRFAITPNTAAKKLKVGTRVLIYAR